LKVSLIGFMGSGKTTVGKLLAEELKVDFLDLDDLIVKETGKSVPQIFQEWGERRFRELERKLLLKVLNSPEPAVISLGGGTPCFFNNVKEINEKSFSVFLYAPFETLWSRIEKDPNRPLTKLGRERLKKLYNERLPYYKRAKLKVNSHELTPEETVKRILDSLNASTGKPSR